MKAHSIRPAYFYPPDRYPEDAKHQRTSVAALTHRIFSPVLGCLYPAGLTPIDDLGKFSVEVAKGRWPEQEMFRHTELRNLMNELREEQQGAVGHREEL